MCGICKNRKARDMDIQVVKFLVNHGSFPAFTKVDERMNEAAERLGTRLNRMQGGLEQTFIEALRDRGYLPSSQSEQEDFISRILSEPFEEMKNAVADAGLDGAILGREMTFGDLAEQGLDLDFTDFSEDVAERLRNQSYQFSDETFNNIQGDFQETLAEGVEEGIGVDDIATDLRHDFSKMRDYRLRTIARTEVLRAQSEGAHETMIENDIEFNQWLTADDGSVREDHVLLHGEVVRVGESFSNGLDKPRDASGPAEQVINCRCRKRPYIPSPDEQIDSTPYYP